MWELRYGKGFDEAEIIHSGTEKECREALDEILSHAEIMPKYVRTWKNSIGVEVFDFGSWTHFYYIGEKPEVKEVIAELECETEKELSTFSENYSGAFTMLEFVQQLIKNHTVIRHYLDNGENNYIAEYIVIIGYTMVNYTLILHYVDAEGAATVDDLPKNYTSFMLLKNLFTPDGQFDIFEEDQFE